MARTAKQMQAASVTPSQEEQKIRLTIWQDNSYHFAHTLPVSAVLDLLDPEVADAFIEIDPPPNVKGVRRYLHTSRIGMVDIHDPLPQLDDLKKPTSSNKGG